MQKIIHVLNKSFLLLVFTVFFSIGILSAQDGWERVFAGNNSFDDTYDIAISHDGNIVANIFSVDGLGMGELSNVLLKMDNAGNVLWSKNIPAEFGLINMKALSDGGFIFDDIKAGSATSEEVKLAKVDSLGNIQWSFVYDLFFTFELVTITEILEVSDGGILFTGKAAEDFSNQLDSKQYLAKVDANGNLLWQQFYNIKGFASSIVETAQGDFLLGGRDDDLSNPMTTLIKTNSSGLIIWNKEFPAPSFSFVHVSEGQNEEIHLVTNSRHRKLDNQGTVISQHIFSNLTISEIVFLDDGFVTAKGNFSGLILDKRDYDGNTIWQRTHNYQIGTYRPKGILQTTDNGFVIGGYLDQSPIRKAFVLKTDSIGSVYRNQFCGTVKRDENQDCILDANEPSLAGWIITATKPGQSSSTLSDSSGNYFLPVDTGDLELTIFPPNNFWSVCQNNIPITFDSIDNKDTIDFLVQAVVDCPLLEVNSSIPVLRPCFDNSPYHVSWCNNGTTNAENSFLEIVLDSAITPISSTVPWSAQNGDTLIFDLGDIAPGDCDNFSMQLMLDCDATVGAAYCIETHIFPDSLCLPLDSIWNGALVEVNGSCQDSIVNFQIENSGLGDMTQDGSYIIVEDAVLLLTEDFNLLSGQSTSVSFPANGSTYFMMATQEPLAPTNPFPIAFLEGCGVNGTGDFSIGFINQFPNGDNDPFIDTDCIEASAAYDPNDKQGFPIGFESEHFIEPNTDIEYLIRFQNTGTDTAFTVILKDTLSPLLDISTLRPGAGSHDYELKIYGENILEFTFSNIMLPDSNINESASHGFVEFKISQKKDLPIGTVIRNKAAIYFDFNPPIITNETFHTIGLDFITVSLQNPIQEESRIHVYPNPLHDFAIFEIKKELKNGVIEIYDLSGKLAWQQKINGKQFELKRNNLKSGFYFYKISDEGRTINSGKIIVK